MKSMENMHKGHRERMRSRFAEHGLDAFSDVEALEILLFYALPRCNTNEIAHMLLERFGSFRGVLEADASELSTVKGVGESAAVLISLVREMNRRYILSDRAEGRNIMKNTESAVDYIRPLFAYCTDEIAYAVTLNSAGRVLRCHRLAEGMSNRVEFSARQVVDLALRDNAAYIIMAHNHLSDVALPSRADLAATLKIRETLLSIGVTLADHIIVSGDEYVSMRDSGCFIDF